MNLVFLLSPWFLLALIFVCAAAAVFFFWKARDFRNSGLWAILIALALTSILLAVAHLIILAIVKVPPTHENLFVAGIVAVFGFIPTATMFVMAIRAGWKALFGRGKALMLVM